MARVYSAVARRGKIVAERWGDADCAGAQTGIGVEPKRRSLMRPAQCRWPVFLLLVACLPALAHADDKADGKRTISVSAQGEAKAAPDEALLSFSVETTAVKATEATTENAKRSSAVAAAVKPLLEKGDTVSTTRYTLEPRYESVRPGDAREPRITGYVARNEVQVESHQLDKIGALIDAATTAGANRVNNLQFQLSHREEALQSAIEKAGADARAQAESVAKGLGVKLGRVVSASVSSGPIVMPRFARVAMAAEARAPTPIEPGDVSVSANLQVTYEIE
jgi:uncharacterized protein YggE